MLSLFSAEPLQAAAPKSKNPLRWKKSSSPRRATPRSPQTPANVTVITAADIEKTGATTVVEVLDRLEGIQFRTISGNPSQAYIDMRGTGGDNPFGKTLVMLDGRRLNRTDMASINWLQTPVHMIERIEIVRGPGSVLYGDAAIGGVINIIPKKGKGRPVANASVLAGSYGLHNERIGVTGAAGRGPTPWWRKQFQLGYRDRPYAAQGGGFDVGYAAHDLLNVSLGVSFNRTDYQMPGALTKDQMRQDRRQYQPAMPAYFMNANDNNDGRDKYTNVNLGVKSFWGRLGQMDIHFLYGRKDLETNMPSWASSWSPYSYVYSDTSAETYGIAPKYVLERDIGSFRNKVTAGIDYYQEPYQKIFFNDRERTLRLSRAKLRRESAGAYIRDEFNPFKNLVVSAGYRFEETAVSGSNTDFATPTNDFDNRKTYRAQAYEAGLTWLWGQKSKAYARYATVYRIPFLDEIASFNGYGAPSPFLVGLDKEKGKSFEIGSEYFPLKNLKLAVTLYRLDMEDEIQYFIYDPILYLGENRNVGKTRHDGAEISVSYLWEKTLRVYGNFTYAKATFEAGQFNKKEIPMVPNRLMHAGVEIFLPHAVTLRTEVRHTGDAYLSGDNDNNTEKLEAYTLLNAYLFYKPAFGRLQMTVFAAVENLTDTRYCSFGLDYAQYGMPNFYYPMPGRTFKGGLSFEF